MKIYLAARYKRREELCVYRSDLEDLGHIVTSRWLNGSHQLDVHGVPIGESGETLVEGGDDERAAMLRTRFCNEDLDDVLAAECVISFTEEPRRPSNNRGGRHVEFGIALARRASGLPIRLITVGRRENIFHWLDYIEFYDSWAEAHHVLSNEATDLAQVVPA